MSLEIRNPIYGFSILSNAVSLWIAGTTLILLRPGERYRLILIIGLVFFGTVLMLSVIALFWQKHGIPTLCCGSGCLFLSFTFIFLCFGIFQPFRQLSLDFFVASAGGFHGVGAIIPTSRLILHVKWINSLEGETILTKCRVFRDRLNHERKVNFDYTACDRILKDAKTCLTFALLKARNEETKKRLHRELHGLKEALVICKIEKHGYFAWRLMNTANFQGSYYWSPILLKKTIGEYKKSLILAQKYNYGYQVDELTHLIRTIQGLIDFFPFTDLILLKENENWMNYDRRKPKPTDLPNMMTWGLLERDKVYLIAQRGEREVDTAKSELRTGRKTQALEAMGEAMNEYSLAVEQAEAAGFDDLREKYRQKIAEIQSFIKSVP